MPDTAPSALFLTGDLMFAAKVQAAAARTGRTLQVVMSAAALVDRVASSVRLVLIDLTAPSLAIADLVPKLRAFDAPLKIIAYAPHVHEETLSAAAEAGCDLVLTRGQFNAQVDALLQGD